MGGCKGGAAAQYVDGIGHTYCAAFHLSRLVVLLMQSSADSTHYDDFRGLVKSL